MNLLKMLGRSCNLVSFEIYRNGLPDVIFLAADSNQRRVDNICAVRYPCRSFDLP
jgi:hypothetical protein